MDKNTITGFVLIGLILFGFTWYQSRQYDKQIAYQAQLDSIAAVERAAGMAAESIADSLQASAAEEGAAAPVQGKAAIYKDSLLNLASGGEERIVTISNDKIEVAFTTKGAQPYSAKVKEYRNYDSTDLYIFRPGASEMGIGIYAGETINTKDFYFDVIEATDSSAAFSLQFAGGGSIIQRYALSEGSYMMTNTLTFKDMDNVIPKNATFCDFDWALTIPRMEKGYKNEMQYSKVDYYFDGEKKPEEIGRGRNASKRIENSLEWFAFQQQFFSAILYSPDNFTSGTLSQQFYPENNREGNLMACKSSMEVAYQPGESVEMPFQFYFGPNHFKTLRSYDHSFEKIVPLGGWLIGWINRVIIINCFDFLNGFISNYGIIILLLTILIKLVISPLTLKSYLSTAKMRVLKPEIEKINAKYPKKEDALKKQQETMALYKKTGVSMFGGCLPMLLQFPILFAMFRFFPASFELRQQSFLWADDLSTYDSVLNLPFSIPLYGDHVSLFALLMAISMFFYSKITMNQMPSNDGMPGMKFMQLYFMPLFLLVLCNNFSSGLSYYYMLSNFITIIQTWVIRKYFVDEKALYAKLQAKAASSKPAKKSKFQQRLDELYKQQQEQLRKQQGRR